MNDARRRLWKIMDRQKAAYRRTMKGIFIRAFDEQIKPLYEKIMQASDIRDIEIPPLNDEAIKKAYTRLYQAVAVPFAMQKRKQWKKATKADDDEIFEDMITREALIYLEQHAGITITAVGDTSKQLIEDLLHDLTPEILDQGLGGGAAQTMLRDRIASEWHQMKYHRTERIVRTEVNRASNWGALQGSKSLKVEMDKVWISAFTAHSRIPHMDADGQKVGLYDPFIVDGEELEYPGDPAGSAGNTINCLCSTYDEIR